MRSLLQNRVALACASVALLLVTFFIGYSHLSTRPAPIGDFALPFLSGWERTSHSSTSLRRVNYEKKQDGHRLFIGMVWHFDRATNPPKTVQDLQNELTTGFAGTAPIMQSLGMKSQFGAPIPMQLNNMIAVTAQALTTSSSDTTFGRVIEFVNGSNYYILTANITVPSTSASSAPPELQAEMDQALGEITKSLVPSTG